VKALPAQRAGRHCASTSRADVNIDGVCHRRLVPHRQPLPGREPEGLWPAHCRPESPAGRGRRTTRRSY